MFIPITNIPTFSPEESDLRKVSKESSSSGSEIDMKEKNIENVSFNHFSEEINIIEELPVQPIQKKKFSFLGTPGKGLNFLGTICSIATTIFLTIRDKFSSSAKSENLLKEGSMLDNRDVQQFIGTLSENHQKDFHFIHEFLSEGNAINKNSLNEVMETDSIKNLLNKDRSHPIIVPLVIAKEEFFGRNHIVVVIIKDNTVRYFDAKGKFSHHIKLDEKGKTVRDVLEFFKDNFTKNGKIVENEAILQIDSNNCGVYVCREIRSQILENRSVEEFSNQAPSLKELKEFRQDMLQQKNLVNSKYA